MAHLLISQLISHLISHRVHNVALLKESVLQLLNRPVTLGDRFP